jgi:hypothetical protein
VGLLTGFFGWLAKIAGNAIVGIFGEWQRSRNEQKLGRAEGATETGEVIARKADDQAALNAADRGDKDDVADRLAHRLGRVPDAEPGARRKP